MMFILGIEPIGTFKCPYPETIVLSISQRKGCQDIRPPTSPDVYKKTCFDTVI